MRQIEEIEYITHPVYAVNSYPGRNVGLVKRINDLIRERGPNDRSLIIMQPSPYCPPSRDPEMRTLVRELRRIHKRLDRSLRFSLRKARHSFIGETTVAGKLKTGPRRVLSNTFRAYLEENSLEFPDEGLEITGHGIWRRVCVTDFSQYLQMALSNAGTRATVKIAEETTL